MKRTVWFITILVLVVIVLYMEPVFFPPNSPKPSTENSPTVTEKVSSLDYEKIPTEGFSVYINKPESELKKDLGEPIEVNDTGFGYTTSVYEDEVRKLFIEANIVNHTVESIKVAGKSTDKIAPFHFGMSLTELTDITTLFPNFSFDVNNEKIDIELSEEDMNYRPLIAFDNDTFAILFFGQENSELYAIDYLNKDTLAYLMPYQVNSGTSMSYELEDSSLEKQQEVDQNNSERAKLLISYLQKNEGLDSFSSSTSLHSEASSLLNKFDNYPEELLENDELNDWQNIFPGAPVYDNVLVTTDHLKNAKDFQEKNVAVLATKPVLDVSFTILEWFSDPYIHSRFITESDKEKLMEIAFSKESMVVLLQEENKETEDSGN